MNQKNAEMNFIISKSNKMNFHRNQNSRFSNLPKVRSLQQKHMQCKYCTPQMVPTKMVSQAVVPIQEKSSLMYYVMKR